MKKFVIVFVFFTLFFGNMAYLGGVLQPMEAAPIILGGSAIIALAWVLLGSLFGNLSRPEKGE